jgi:hypothetical protein
MVTEGEVVDCEQLAVAGRHLLPGLDDLIPGLERRLHARVVHDVLAVGQDDGVQFVAYPVDLPLPGPGIRRRRLVDVVYVVADAIGQVHER